MSPVAMIPTVMVDTREQKNHVTDYLNAHGIPNERSKLFVGDYTRFDNQMLCVDRKHNLTEVCGNLCQQHDRFKRELERAQRAGVKLIFLIEHSRSIRSLEDVRKWKNPRLEVSPYALSGEGLYKRMRTIESRYGIEWQFCGKQDTGKRICKILGVEICENLPKPSVSASPCGKWLSG